MSVSYTHLDVYKRQVRDFMDSYRNAPLVPPPLVTGRDLVNLGLSPGPDFVKWLSRLQELQSVSYTHLDVYKRQI